MTYETPEQKAELSDMLAVLNSDDAYEQVTTILGEIGAFEDWLWAERQKWEKAHDIARLAQGTPEGAHA